jgi:CDP-diacylglycerol--serine O-phosphatidyltransferase
MSGEKRGAPLKSRIPNFITLLNLAVGTVATVLALEERIIPAAILVIVATILDFLDGFAARLLRARSDIGMNLDSLADLVSFGVAPAALAYTLIGISLSRYGYDPVSMGGVVYTSLPMLIVLFSAVRLARFNVKQSKDFHFTGLPVPANAAAYVALSLIIGGSRYSRLAHGLLHPGSLITIIIVCSVLMLAPIKMFSFKLDSYRFSDNRWRYLFTLIILALTIVFGGAGIGVGFLLYLIASVVMDLRIRFSVSGESS